MRLGRHSRGRYEWGTEPSRAAERSDAVAAEERDPSKRSPGRKDRKNHCKPARGPHVRAVVMRQLGGKPAVCGWRASWTVRERGWRPEWACFHQEECAACGKWFRFLAGTGCPDWHPITVEEMRAIGPRIAEMVERRESYAQRKPVISGPQGYRRRKGE